MKKIILLVLLFGNIISCFAQTLSGLYRNDGKSTGSYYTKINWSVSYRFEERNGNFYIKFYSPKISVPNYALYHDEFNKEYSLSDIGLPAWPKERQLPFAMSVKINVSDGYTNYDIASSCDADFTCEESYIVSKANVKNANMGNLRVTSVTYFRANLGGEPAVDEILKNRRKLAGRTAQNKSANSSSDNETSSSNASSEKSSAESTSSSSGVTIYNNIFAAENARKNNEQQAVTNVVTEIFNLFKPSPEEERRRSAAIDAAYERSEGERELLRKNKRESFNTIYLPLKEQAIKGDEQSQMLYYFALLGLNEFYNVNYEHPFWEWIPQAVANNNADAMLEYALWMASEPPAGEKNRVAPLQIGYDFTKAVPILEKAAALGSTDAMIQLAHWYDRATYTVLPYMVATYRGAKVIYGGNNAALALKWFKQAADAGCPNAAYYLGMIHLYGQTIKFGKKSILKDGFIKYDLKRDEKTAFDYFQKSQQPDYKTSLFSKGRYQESEGHLLHYTSYFNCNTYIELAEMYNKGKVVEKDKLKAGELLGLYSKYVSSNRFF